MSLSLLLVQNDPVHSIKLQNHLMSGLVDCGHTLATTIGQALDYVKQQSFDVVLTDHTLPDGSGLTILHECPEIPVIYMIRSGEESCAVKAMQGGASDYIIKDNSDAYLNLLPFTIRQVVEHHRNTKQWQIVASKLNEAAYLPSNASDVATVKAAEETLLKNEERYRIISELASDYAFLYSVDANGAIKLEWTTDSYTRITGYPIGEPQGKQIYGLYAPEYREKVQADIQSGLQGNIVEGEYQIITRQGEERWLRVSRYPIWDEQHTRVIQFYGAAQDITARKQAEAAQHMNKELYLSLVESTDASIALVDHTGKVLYINSIAARILGSSSEKLVNKFLYDLFPEYRAELIIGMIQSVIQTDQGEVLESEIALAGKQVWHRTSMQPVRDDSGRPYAILIHSNDITDKKLAEQSIRSQNEILQQSHDLIALVDTNGYLTYVNKGGASLIQVNNPNELVGKSIAEFILPEHRKRVLYEALPVAAQTGQWRGETRLKSTDGRLIDVDQSIFPIRDSNNTITHYATIMVDITDRKKTEDALRQSENHLRSLVDSQTAYNIRVDMNGNISYCNKRYQEQFSWAAPSLIGTSSLELVIPEDQVKVVEAVSECIKNVGKLVRVELREPTADGNPIWILWEFVAIQGDDGLVQELQCIGFDITKQKLADEELKGINESLEQRVTERTIELERTKNRIEAIFNHSGDSILLLDVLLGIQQANYAFDVLFGVQTDSYVGKQLTSLAISDYEEKISTTIQEVIATHQKRQLDVVAERPDGSLFDIEISIAPVNRSEQNISLLVCIIRDITARKQAEESLRESESRYRSMFEHNRAVKLLIDYASGQIMDANSAATEFYGYSIETLKSMRIQDINMLPSEAIKAEMALAETEQREVFQFRHRLANGEIRIVEVYSGPVIIQGRHCLYSIILDVTARTHAEEALRQSESRQRSILENMQDVVWSIDLVNYKLSYVSPLAKQIYGRSEADFYADNELWYKIVHPEDEERLIRAQRAILERGFRDLEYRIVHPNGDIRWIRDHAWLVKDTEGNPLRLEGVASDITARKQVETLQQAFLDDMRALQQLHLELSETNDLETLYQKIIVLTQQRLGIDRVGLFVLDSQQNPNLLFGTYGIDPNGGTRDEHYYQEEITANHWTVEVLNSTDHVKFWDNAPIRDNGQDVGKGWKAASALWNGHKATGYLVIDNFVTRKQARPYEAELLSILGSTFGHLIERAQTERTLRESENMLKNVIENIPFRIFWKDKKSVYRGCNSLHARGNGLGSTDDIVGKSDHDFLPERAAEWEADDRRIMESGHPKLNVEEVVIDADGSSHWLRSNKVVLRDSEGLANGTLVTIEDITERRRAEEVLQKTKDQLQAILDHSTASIFMKDLDGRILLLNRATELDFGICSNEWVGKLEADIFPGETDKYYKSLDSKVVEARAAISYEDKFKGRTCLVTKFPIFDSHNQIYAIGGISTDITDRKHFEESLERALEQEKELGELKSRFVSMASHEFRTPLAAILATTETLTLYRAKMNDVQINARLDKIRQQVAHMRDIMEDVLQLSRIQAGKVEFNPSDDDLNALCQEIVEEFDSQPQHHGRIIYTCTQTEVLAQFDRRMMRQVISNLISNGLKYSLEGKLIHVELTQDDRQMVLKVVDQGIGIPPDDQKHLFEPFHRATNVGTISGTGLGMSITKQAVEMHHGSIVPDSRVGIGTTFTVTLPNVVANTEKNYA